MWKNLEYDPRKLNLEISSKNSVLSILRNYSKVNVFGRISYPLHGGFYNFNEVHRITRDYANHNFGDYYWYPGCISVNMSYSLTDLDSGNGRKRGCFILICCLIWKIDSIWGGISWVHVHIVCDGDIRGGCGGMRTT